MPSPKYLPSHTERKESRLCLERAASLSLEMPVGLFLRKPVFLCNPTVFYQGVKFPSVHLKAAPSTHGCSRIRMEAGVREDRFLELEERFHEIKGSRLPSVILEHG